MNIEAKVRRLAPGDPALLEAWMMMIQRQRQADEGGGEGPSA